MNKVEGDQMFLQRGYWKDLGVNSNELKDAINERPVSPITLKGGIWTELKNPEVWKPGIEKTQHHTELQPIFKSTPEAGNLVPLPYQADIVVFEPPKTPKLPKANHGPLTRAERYRLRELARDRERVDITKVSSRSSINPLKRPVDNSEEGE